MPTVLRVYGFRFIGNTDDHGDPHVHVRKDGLVAKIVIGDEKQAASVLQPGAMSEKDLRRAVRIFDENCGSFWKYGGDTMRRPLTDEQIRNSLPAARAREAGWARIEPRAMGARYDAGSGRIVVELVGGCEFAFPAGRGSGLENATPKQLASVEVEPGGETLHWEELDADISLPGLIARLLKLEEWAPRILGQRRSELKATASRENGRKGGRPRKRAAAADDGGGAGEL